MMQRYAHLSTPEKFGVWFFVLAFLYGMAFGIFQIWDLTVLQDRQLDAFDYFSRLTRGIWFPLAWLVVLLAPRRTAKHPTA